MTHYYSEDQESKFVPEKISAKLRGRDIEFNTSGGVFSKKHVDNATELLINNAIIKDGWDILDLGCGYGPVGITLAKLFPECNIFMTDISKRAHKLSRMNIKLHKLTNVKLTHGNLFAKLEEQKFDTIIVNPPFSAGRKICFEMIDKSKNHLKKGGLLQLVARHQKGGKVLEERMEKIFGNVEATAKGSGFRVYVSKNE